MDGKLPEKFQIRKSLMGAREEIRNPKSQVVAIFERECCMWGCDRSRSIVWGDGRAQTTTTGRDGLCWSDGQRATRGQTRRGRRERAGRERRVPGRERPGSQRAGNQTTGSDDGQRWDDGQLVRETGSDEGEPGTGSEGQPMAGDHPAPEDGH